MTTQRIHPDRLEELSMPSCFEEPPTVNEAYAMAGQREVTISEILGHKRPGVTARYAHLDIEHLRAAVESIVARQINTEEKFG